MADCEHLTNCAFFGDKMPDTSGLGAMYKKKYCQGDNLSCARYIAAKELGGDNIPRTLYPNNIEDAKKLIAEKKKLVAEN